MQIRKAERKKAKLRMALCGTSGSGKTYSALLIAMGIGGKIGMIDTENGSGDLYADEEGFDEYDIIRLEPDYEIKKFIEAIKTFEKEGYDTIIIDSLSHAWAGQGGLLQKQGRIEDASKSGNGWAAWRKITPEHESLVEAMLSSKCHIIATMRSKTEHTQEGGKVIKIGLAPVQRDGMEYEFTCVLDIANGSHMASASKDRTKLFDGRINVISKQTGVDLKNWLEKGKDENSKNDIEERTTLQIAKEIYRKAKEINDIDILNSYFNLIGFFVDQEEMDGDLAKIKNELEPKVIDGIMKLRNEKIKELTKGE